MMAKSQITKGEAFEAIQQYIQEKYGIKPSNVKINFDSYDLKNVSFDFEVKPIKEGSK